MLFFFTKNQREEILVSFPLPTSNIFKPLRISSMKHLKKVSFLGILPGMQTNAFFKNLKQIRG